jgi:hypothetical protein
LARRSASLGPTPRAQFHERQFELAANIELISGRGTFFAPPPTAEQRLGIDCALTPGDARIWKLLGLPAPTGTAIGASTFQAWPSSFPPGASPPFLASLFVQYKRPDYLTTRRAAEWQHHGSPYYRIHLTPHQHQRLIDLSQTVGSDGVVLYVAPSFWRYDELWLKQGAGQIMEASMLKSASQLASGHHRWTWTPGGRGSAHSELEDGEYSTIVELRDQLTTLAANRPRKTPRDHLGAIADAMLEAGVSEKRREQWRDEMVLELRQRDEQVDEEVVSELADAAVVAEGATRAKVSWLILALSLRGPSAAS